MPTDAVEQPEVTSDLLTADDWTGATPSESAAPPASESVQTDEAVSGGDAAPASPSPVEAVEQQQSIRDYLTNQLGYALPDDVTDPHSVLAHVVSAARQNALNAELGRQLAPRADQIREFLAQPKTPVAVEPKPWEEPKGFDPRFAHLVDFNEQAGVFVGKPGTPQHITDKVNEYADWKRRMDTPEVRNAHIEAIAIERAEALIEKKFEAHREQQEVRSIEAQNAAWFYQVDGQGRPVLGRDGQYVPSTHGARYMALVNEARQMGVTGVRNLDSVARRLLAADLLHQSSMAKPQPQAVRAAAASAPNRNALQSLQPAARLYTPGASEPDAAGLSLRDRLMRSMDADGVTSEEIAATLAG